MRATPLFTAALTLSLVSGVARAQDKPTKPTVADKADRATTERIESRDELIRTLRSRAAGMEFERSPRAMIGVNTSSSGKRDTLGLLVTSVTPGGPAEKAGIVEGNRIASVNGVNLRLNAADAGEDDMEGITARRLTRELGKLKPGAEVDLRVYADGQWKNVKVKTVSSDSLRGERGVMLARSTREERPVLGFSLNSSGNKRDTLGVLITDVEENGPAEKAGLVEGDRIASVNGTDLRVKRDDVGDDYVGNAMVSRFQRVMRGVKPGDKVELRVYSGGQTKTLSVSAARAADIYKEGERRFRMMMPGMSLRMGEMGEMGVMPAMPPMPPMPPDGDFLIEAPPPGVGPRPMRIRRPQIHSMDLHDIDVNDVDVEMDLDIDIDFESIPDFDIEIEAPEGFDAAAKNSAKAAIRAHAEAKALNTQTREMVKALMDQQRSLERAQARSASWTATSPADELSGLLAALNDVGPSDDNRSSTFRVAGLTLAPVTTDLAEYLGEGSRDGLLVLESEGEWSAIHPGDVLLSVDGRCVTASDDVSTLDAEDAHDIVVLRKGKRLTIHLVGG